MPPNLGPTSTHAQLDRPHAHLPHPHIPTMQTQLSSHHGTKERSHVLQFIVSFRMAGGTHVPLSDGGA